MVQADGLQHGQSVPITRSQSSLIFFQLRNRKDGVYISGRSISLSSLLYYTSKIFWFCCLGLHVDDILCALDRNNSDRNNSNDQEKDLFVFFQISSSQNKMWREQVAPKTDKISCVFFFSKSFFGSCFALCRFCLSPFSLSLSLHVSEVLFSPLRKKKKRMLLDVVVFFWFVL